MPAGQKSGTGAMSELDDEKVRKNEILSNRDKTQRAPSQSLDNKGIQVDEYKDIPTNQRPAPHHKPAPDDESEMQEQVDRPGFDLGEASGDTKAGKG